MSTTTTDTTATLTPPPMSGISLGLTRITSLLTALRSPHLATPIVHIAGTNGKGSVSAYLSFILTASSLRIGRFNSPHLVDEWDCLELNGKTVSQADFETTKREVREVDQRERIGSTEFEILTATAFALFARARPKLDLAVVEVGMGGRDDATNVVDADKTLLSIVTSIELDHQKFLGDTIEEIAMVKTGIVKRGGEVVLAKQEHPEVEAVLQEVVKELGARAWIAGEGVAVEDDSARATTATDAPTAPLVSLPLTPIRTFSPSSTPPPPFTSSVLAHLPLPGSYQLANAAAAVLAAQVLRISPHSLAILPSLADITDTHIRSGIEATRWPGRLDWITLPSSLSSSSAPLLVDGAHNPSSATFLASYLASLPPHQQPATLILGLSFPRAPITILTPLLASPSRLQKVVCVPFTAPESMPWIKPTATGDIARAAIELGVQVVECENVEQALRGLEEGERAVVAGSLYLAADVYRLVRRLEA